MSMDAHPVTEDLNDYAQSDPLLAGLTAPQQQAVVHLDGPLLVLAGPGSGKTRVITRRVAHLIQRCGVAPWNVLAITFTNKAAAEMRERVGALLTERQSKATTIATFHSLCARLLRQYADKLGLPPGYSIYDSSDQKRAMKQALEDLEISTKNFPPASMLAAISNAKNDLIGPEQFAVNADNFYDRTVAKVYTHYSAILKKCDALDFDDLLLKAYELLRDHQDVCDKEKARFKFVLIDEYQDTNKAQFLIASVLGQQAEIMVTGDPDQSIYAWRGADISNIIEFEDRYPNSTVIRLEQNFRSTKQILAAADSLIRNNTGRRHKELWTDNPEGEPVKIAAHYDERSEARWVAETFRDLHDKKDMPWGHMAVFYRVNTLSRVMEDALRDSGIPYQIVKGTAFYDRKEVKDAIAYLRTIANPADEINLLRIINTPARGISTATTKKMQAHSLTHNMPMDAILANPMGVTLNTRAQNAIAKFDKILEGWKKTVESDGVDDGQDAGGDRTSLRYFVERVLRESGLEDHYRNDKSDPDGTRFENLGELVSAAQQFETEYIIEIEADSDGRETDAPLQDKLLAFLERIALIADIDGLNSEQGQVTLMTLHAAKGLEFPAVAMIGFEDGLLPHQRANNDESELEEERRLAFVGITRAQEYLYLTHAKSRTIFGQTQSTIRSRFFDELPENAVEFVEPERDGFDDSDPFAGRELRSTAAKQATLYPKGTKVRHPQFGIGEVLDVQAMGSITRASVRFNTHGRKTLILQYANLERLGGPPETDPSFGDAFDDDIPI